MEQQGLSVPGGQDPGWRVTWGQEASQVPVPQYLSKASREDPEMVVRSNQKSIS